MSKKMVKLMLGLVLIAISIVCLNAVIVGNDPYSPFRGQSSVQVGDMIAESASELLQSASEAFLFLNEVEIAEKNGLNIPAALQRVDLASAKAEQALILFRNIIQVGLDAGYDERRIQKLKNFSYEQFARENGLSGEIMNQVSTYLGRGNVLGFYHRHANNLQGLLTTLTRIKADLLAGKLSKNQVLWSLLQQYNSTMMFGNYASLVFYKI
ncbi:MAG TPA: hypothetical protein VLQ89_00720 [Candidatus Binatia bacterium]|nr:hypothetical protein [Candidatus Binatia bacterium]